MATIEADDHGRRPPLLAKDCPARLVDARDPDEAIVLTDKQS